MTGGEEKKTSVYEQGGDSSTNYKPEFLRGSIGNAVLETVPYHEMLQFDVILLENKTANVPKIIIIEEQNRDEPGDLSKKEEA